MTYVSVELAALPRWLDAVAAYYTVILLRCTVVSTVLLLLIALLRMLFSKKPAYIRVLLWLLLPLAFFTGKIRAYYEVRTLAQIFLRIQAVAFDYRLLRVFVVAGTILLLARFIMMHIRWRREIHLLPMNDLHGIRVRIAPTDPAPFATGLLHPCIVVPQRLHEDYDGAEVRMMLVHEQTHIRAGHLWILMFYEILCCLWFLNPLMHFGKRKLMQDLEEMTDASCLQRQNLNARDYGALLLKVAGRKRLSRMALSFCAFSGRDSFARLHRRLEQVMRFRPVKRRAQLAHGAMAAVAFASGILLLSWLSYPVYTVQHDISVLNSKYEAQFLPESEALKSAVVYDDELVRVDPAALGRLLEAQGFDDKTFWLYFDGFYKIPGIGGGGQVIEVDLQAAPDVDGIITLPYEATTDIVTEVFKRL